MREVIFNDFTSGIQCDKIENFGKGTDTKSANLYQNSQNLHSNTANLNHTQNPQAESIQETTNAPQEAQPTQETTQSGSIFEIESGFSSEPTRSLLNINDAVGERRIADSSQKDNADTPKQITLHSKYGNTKATFETTSASIMLPLTKGGEYFIFDDVRFFVIAGEGALYYLDCVKAYDFTNLEAECLEQFLLTGKQPRDYKQRGLIKDFLDIDTKNIQKGKMYLLPKGYEMIAQSLIQGN